MKETDEDLCAALVTRENYAIVVSELSVETCSNEDARCQLRFVGESLYSSHIALGLQKSKKTRPGVDKFKPKGWFKYSL